VAKDHLRGIYPSGCGLTDSKGVRIIKKLLNDNNINYSNEYSYEDCKYINNLKFDFYLPDLNLLIEYDGRQHSAPNDYFGGIESYELTKKRDCIKDTYALKNGIKLIRISHEDNISEEIENKVLIFNK
jgi:very-short-patch-repair endonuclease